MIVIGSIVGLFVLFVGLDWYVDARMNTGSAGPGSFDRWMWGKYACWFRGEHAWRASGSGVPGHDQCAVCTRSRFDLEVFRG
jgi:hypothetical protein